MTLTLNFQGQILHLPYLRKKWPTATKRKKIHFDLMQGLKRDPEFWPWPWPWPWIFKVKYRISYISGKNCLITMKPKIDWTIGLRCDFNFWPWSWPWPWIFKATCLICYISGKYCPIATKPNINISNDHLKASKVAINFYLGHDFDLEFSRSNV